jgi:transposase-like protein
MAIAAIPNGVHKRIVAFVSDGFRSSARLARQYGWIHQRCHFHLLAQLQVNRGAWKLRSSSDRPLRESIYQDVRSLLTETSVAQRETLVTRLRQSIAKPACPRRLGMIVRELLRHRASFLAYLQYPALNLPTTTNTVESMNRLLRRKTRMLPTPAALSLWVTVMVRTIKTITCNGHRINQIK